MFYFLYNFDSYFFALTLNKSHVNVGIDLEKLGPGIESLPKNQKSKKLFLILNNIPEIRGNRHQKKKKKTTEFSCIIAWSRDLLSLCNCALKREEKSCSRTFWVPGNQCSKCRGRAGGGSDWRWDNTSDLLLLHYPHAPKLSIPPRFISRQVLPSTSLKGKITKCTYYTKLH